MEWSDEVICQLRALWAEGHPTAEIGRRLNVTKNAIVGKAHRLDLPARPSPIRRDPNTPEAIRRVVVRRLEGPTLPPLPSAVADAEPAYQMVDDAFLTPVTPPERTSPEQKGPERTAQEFRIPEPLRPGPVRPGPVRPGPVRQEPVRPEPLAPIPMATAPLSPGPFGSEPRTAEHISATVSRAPATVAPAVVIRPAVMVTPPTPPRPAVAVVRPALAQAPRPAPSVPRPVPSSPRFFGRVVTCCWPIGEPGTREFQFCDLPSEPSRPYCEEHVKVAYVRIRERREDAA